MALDHHDYNIVVRATDLSTLPITTALAAVKKMTEAVAEQVELSQKGATKNTEFTKSLRDLEEAQRSLLAQKSALRDFDRLEDGLTAKRQALAEQQAKRDAAYLKAPDASARTDKQNASLQRFDDKVNKAEQAVNKASDAVARGEERLAGLGITAGEVASSYETLRTAINDVTKTLLAGGEAYRDFGANQKAARLQAEALAKAASDAARAQKEADELRAASERNQLATRKAQAAEEQELAALLVSADKARADAATAAAKKIADAAHAERAARESANAKLLSGIVGETDSSAAKVRTEAEAKKREDERAAAQKLRDDRAIQVADAQAVENQRVEADRLATQKLKDGRTIEVRDAEAVERQRQDLFKKQIEAQKALRAFEVADATQYENQRVAALRDGRTIEYRDAEAYEKQRQELFKKQQAAEREYRAFEVADAEAVEKQRKALFEEQVAAQKALRAHEVSDAAAVEKQRKDALKQKEQGLRDGRKIEVDDATEYEKQRQVLLKKQIEAENAYRAFEVADATEYEKQRVAKLKEADRAARQDARAARRAAKKEASETEKELNGQRTIQVADAGALDDQIEAARKKAAAKAKEEAAAEARAKAAHDRLTQSAQQNMDAFGTIGTPRVGLGLRERVDAILPGREVSSLAAADESLKRLEAALKTGATSAQNYAKIMDDFYRVQAKLSKDTDIVEALHEQFQARVQLVAQLNKEFEETQRLIALQRKGEGSANELSQAQANYGRTSAAYQRNVQQYNELVKLARARGIEENNLGKAQAHILEQTTKLAEVSSRVKVGAKGLFGLDQFGLQNLSYQINDVVTQLSLGQGITRTLASQGGQIFQLFNVPIQSLLRYLPLIGAVGVAVGGLIAVLERFTDKAAALRGFEGRLTAMADGARYAAKNLLGTQLAIEKLGVSFEEAGDAVKVFLEAGVRPERMVQLAKAARDVSDVYGGDFKDRVKEITSAFTGGYEAIDKLDQSLGFLTTTQRTSIRTLFENGEAAKGAALALGILSERNADAAVKSNSSWTVAVRELKNAWHELLDVLGDSKVVTDIVDKFTTMADRIRSIIELGKSGKVPSLTDTYGSKPGDEAKSIGQIITGFLTGRNLIGLYSDIANAVEKGTAPDKDKVKVAVNSARAELADLQARADKVRSVIDKARAEGTSDEALARPIANLKTLLEMIVEAKKSLETIQLKVAPESGMSEVGIQDRLKALEAERAALKNRPPGDTGPAPIAPPTETRSKAGFNQLLEYSAQVAGINPDFFKTLQKSENATRNADGTWPRSKTGPQGALQLAQDTFDELKRNNPTLIPGDILDDRSNAMAGALYARQRLDQTQGNVRLATERYHMGPTAPADRAALKQGAEVDAGFKGNPYQGRTVEQIDAEITSLNAQLGRLKGSATGAASALSIQDAATLRLRGDADRKAEQLDDENTLRKNAQLRGRAREQADAAALIKYEEKLKIAAGPAFEAEGPEGERLRAGIKLKVDLERAERAREREKQQEEEDNKLKAEIARRKAERQAQIESERSLLGYRSELRAAADKEDATNAEAQAAAVQERFNTRVEKLRADAVRTGVFTVAGVPLDQFIATLEKDKNDLIALVTAKAEVAGVDKLVQERAEAYKKIQDDLKNGLISITEAFQRAQETTRNFAPRVSAAVSRARADLAKQGQTAAVRESEQKLDSVDSPASTIELNKATVDASIAQLQKIDAARRSVEQANRAMVANGEISQQTAINTVRGFYEKVAPASIAKINEIQKALDDIAKSPNPFPEEDAQRYNEILANMREKIKYVDEDTKRLREGIASSFTDNAIRALDTVAESIGKFAVGTGTLKDVFRTVGSAFAQMTAGILRDIATIILRTLILRAVQAGINYATGGGGEDTSRGGSGQLSSVAASGLATFASAIVKHDGGIIGAPGGMSRVVDISAFRNARRMHGGGMVGLANDEYATILQRGEEVTSASAVRQKAMASGGGGGGGTSVRNVLAVGDQEIAGAMAGAHGERVILNVLKRNSPTIRNWVT